MSIKTGDVVQLKSGGPEMTVLRIIGEKTASMTATKTQDYALKQAGYRDGDVVCQWFNSGKLETGTFKADMLENAG
jgi:uncharacterized protein YodC (DUF2158 family)